jgi:hypothetical protein
LKYVQSKKLWSTLQAWWDMAKNKMIYLIILRVGEFILVINSLRKQKKNKINVRSILLNRKKINYNPSSNDLNDFGVCFLILNLFRKF